MKKSFSLLFGCIACCLTLGCQKGSESSSSSADLEPASGTPDLFPIECLSSQLTLYPYILDKGKPMTLGNVKFLVAPKYGSGEASVFPDYMEYADQFVLYEDDIRSYLSKIEDQVKQAKETAPISYHLRQEEMYLGGIVSPPSITADKVLFGHPAGDDLIDFFQVCETGGETHYQFWYPDYTLKGFNPSVTVDVPLSEIYSPGTMLLPSCYFRFKEIPTEKYDSITLTLEIPIQGESSIRFLPDVDPSEAMVKATLSGSVTIDFNK